MGTCTKGRKSQELHWGLAEFEMSVRWPSGDPPRKANGQLCISKERDPGREALGDMRT